MAEIGNIVTLMDAVQANEGAKENVSLVNLMSQKNDILQDIHWEKANRIDSHFYQQIVELPTPGWRRHNEGATVSKGVRADTLERSGILEEWSRIDETLVELEDDPQAFRMGQAEEHIEAMVQEAASAIFNADPLADPKKPRGLAPRYNSLTGNWKNQVISGGTVTGNDGSSIWLVGWGPNTVHCFYPSNSMAGLKRVDWGKRPNRTGTGIDASTLAVYEDQFQWKFGLAIPDPRYVVRIPNIDVSALTTKSSATNLVDAMIKATHRIPNLTKARLRFYMNRDVFQMLHIQCKDIGFGTNGTVTVGTNYGAAGAQVQNAQPVTQFLGIPCRVCDAITSSESAVS